mmetsp:Transcript_58114/g.142561  ORF Transcript_58114/g.142561 Transcript_58114/m.142561 type:complete len:149 (+) Transcript_58114:156-602(+)
MGSSLEQHVAKRAMLQEELVKLEKNIFENEASYLEETAQTGNILRGWEGYFQSISQQRGNAVRPNKIKNSDRIFSLSSVTAPKAPHQPEDDVPAPATSNTSQANRKDRDRDRRPKVNGSNKRDSGNLGRAKLGRKRSRESEDEEEYSD